MILCKFAAEKFYKMPTIDSKTTEFIIAHKQDDVRTLALQAAKYHDIDINEALVQISGRQIAEKKIPSWANEIQILYPKHLSMEQCSSEVTARYKASLVNGDTLTDLTAGFGVDFSFIARNFKKADYVERQETLCEIAKHNFNILGLAHVSIHNTDGIEYLKTMQPVDCLFLDPARRDANGGKTVAISECEPDVCKLEPLLVEKGRKVLIKLSPMLDMHSALNELENVREIHIVSVNNECKELIIILEKKAIASQGAVQEITITCEQIVNNFPPQHFSFTLSEEKSSACPTTEKIGNYIYEPGAALLKAGPYRLLTTRFDVEKLHPNSHLYTSEKLIDFPGRCFQVIGYSGFGKKELKAFLKDIDKANLTVRNFPATVAELRKKLKLKEGGELYIFATTLTNGEKVLIKGVKC